MVECIQGVHRDWYTVMLQLEHCRPVISKTAHFCCCIVLHGACSMECGLSRSWFSSRYASNKFHISAYSDLEQWHFDLKIVLSVFPRVANLSSKFERCMVFRLKVNDGHRTFLLFNCISKFNCYFIHVYIVTVFTLICGICSSVVSLCNCAVSFVLLYCYIVTLVRLSLVTMKGYLLAWTDRRTDRWTDVRTECDIGRIIMSRDGGCKQQRELLWTVSEKKLIWRNLSNLKRDRLR